MGFPPDVHQQRKMEAQRVEIGYVGIWSMNLEDLRGRRGLHMSAHAHACTNSAINSKCLWALCEHVLIPVASLLTFSPSSSPLFSNGWDSSWLDRLNGCYHGEGIWGATGSRRACEWKSFLLTLLNIDGLITVFCDSAGCVQGSSRRGKRSAALSWAQLEY